MTCNGAQRLHKTDLKLPTRGKTIAPGFGLAKEEGKRVIKLHFKSNFKSKSKVEAAKIALMLQND